MKTERTKLREYNRIHKWVGRHYAKSGICEFCFKRTKTQWSNRTGKYLQVRMDWQELCPRCHHHYDRYVLKANFHKKRYMNRNDEHGVLWDSMSNVKARLETYWWYKE